MTTFGSEQVEPPKPKSVLIKRKKQNAKSKINLKLRPDESIGLVKNCIYAELRNNKLPGIPKNIPDTIKRRIAELGGLSIWYKEHKEYYEIKKQIKTKLLQKNKNLNFGKNSLELKDISENTQSDLKEEIIRRKNFINEAIKSIEHNEKLIKEIESEIAQLNLNYSKTNIDPS